MQISRSQTELDSYEQELGNVGSATLRLGGRDYNNVMSEDNVLPFVTHNKPPREMLTASTHSECITLRGKLLQTFRMVEMFLTALPT